MDSLLLQFSVTGLMGGSFFLLIWSVFRTPVSDAVPVHRQFTSALGAEQRQTFFEKPLLGRVMKITLLWARRLGLPGLRRYIRQHLDASGNPNNYSVDEYLSICLVCSIVMGLSALALSLLVLGTLDLVVICVLGAMGFGIPIWLLKGASATRLMRISKQLPYTLDLIALMMGAGSTFNEAVGTIIRDQPEDELNQELKMVLAQIDLGTSRSEALALLGVRIPLDALRSVIGAANQAQVLGTPLSTIFKSQSDMMRMYRSVRAEKLSASASLRLMFPNVLILVAVVIFLFGPMMIKYMQGSLF